MFGIRHRYALLSLRLVARILAQFDVHEKKKRMYPKLLATAHDLSEKSCAVAKSLRIGDTLQLQEVTPIATLPPHGNPKICGHLRRDSAPPLRQSSAGQFAQVYQQ